MTQKPAYCVRSQTGCPVHTRRAYPHCLACGGDPFAFEVPVCGEELASGQLRWALGRFRDSLEEEWRPLWPRRRAA